MDIVLKILLIIKDLAPLIVSIVIVCLNSKIKIKELSYKTAQEKQTDRMSKGFELVNSLITFNTSLQTFSDKAAVVLLADRTFSSEEELFFERQSSQHLAELNKIISLTKFYFNKTFSNVEEIINLNDEIVMLVFSKNEYFKACYDQYNDIHQTYEAVVSNIAENENQKEELLTVAKKQRYSMLLDIKKDIEKNRKIFAEKMQNDLDNIYKKIFETIDIIVSEINNQSTK